MFLCDVDLEYIKSYLRVDDNNDDFLIQSLWDASISYIKSYTGLTSEEVNKIESLVPVALIYTNNLYDNRTYEINEKVNTSKNMLINNTLNLYCKNNIAL